jgi:hypothetical protein
MTRRVTVFILLATLLNTALVLRCQLRYSVPEFARYKYSEVLRDPVGDHLTAAFGMTVYGHQQAGSAQALEGDVFVPSGGEVPFAIATIGNAFVAGHVGRLRSTQAGGEVSGGTVDSWTLFNAEPATSNGGTIGELIMYRAKFPDNTAHKVGFYADDPDTTYTMRGRILTDEIDFPNGWKLIMRGDGVQLVDQAGRGHGLQ